MVTPATAENRLLQLKRLGQSPWLDSISRGLVRSGRLQRFVDRDGIGGVTSNPAIFEKAIGQGREYDEDILALSRQGLSVAEVHDRLVVEDVRAACDVLAAVYLGSGGEDGLVSIEVDPRAAYDTELTVAEAHRLFAAVDRPNVMVKIPGTREGVPAVRRCLADGLNINITLLFSLSQYEAVAEAYPDALEERLTRDETIRGTSSVASIFVSRVDAMVDRELDARLAAGEDPAERRRVESLKGRAGVANAKAVYERFAAHLVGRRWQMLAPAGGKVQRVLWASTGTKDPSYPDTLYVDGLIGPHTVTTLPEPTLAAFKAHGTPVRTVDRHIEDAHRVLRELGGLGIEMEEVGRLLQRGGVDLFAAAHAGAVDIVARRIEELRTREGA
jgi:transaldolase